VNIVLTLSRPLSILPNTGVLLFGVSILFNSLSTDWDLLKNYKKIIWLTLEIKRTHFLETGVLGEKIFKSESIDLDGVTLIFIESFRIIN